MSNNNCVYIQNGCGELYVVCGGWCVDFQLIYSKILFRLCSVFFRIKNLL